MEKTFEEILASKNTVEDLGNLRDDKQKEIQSARDNREILDIERYNLDLKILELQRSIQDSKIEKNKLEQNLNKAKAIISRLNTELKLVESKFWSVKG